MQFGVASLIFVLIVCVFGTVVVGVVFYVRGLRRQAREAGYDRLGTYLRSPPRNDREKRDAVDLTLHGVVLCLLGLLMPPLLFLGLFPLYYGARKLLLARMGLDLLEETDA